MMTSKEGRRVARALQRGVESTNLPPDTQLKLSAALSSRSALAIIIGAVVDQNSPKAG